MAETVFPDWDRVREDSELLHRATNDFDEAVKTENFWNAILAISQMEGRLEFLEDALVNQGPGETFGAAPLAAAVLTPIAAEVGKAAAEEVRRKVEQERGKRRATHGAAVDYYAAFRGREAATHIARKWQDLGLPAFVYFDPTRPVSSLVAGEEPVVSEVTPGLGGFARKVEDGAVVEEVFDATGRKVRGQIVVPTETLPPEEVLEQERFLMRIPELDLETGRPRHGMWIAEIGEPTDTERELFGAGGLAIVRPRTVFVGEPPPEQKPPKDPKHTKILFFPPRSLPAAVAGEIEAGRMEFGSGDDRPNLLDAIVEPAVVFGGRLTGSPEPAPCDCATIPETGKKLCTRPGIIGVLDQAQVATLCSEFRDLPNGRVDRARALRAAQEVCGILVTNIEDPADRMGARITCLSDQLGESV